MSNKCQRDVEQHTDMLAKLKCLCCLNTEALRGGWGYLCFTYAYVLVVWFRKRGNSLNFPQALLLWTLLNLIWLFHAETDKCKEKVKIVIILKKHNNLQTWPTPSICTVKSAINCKMSSTLCIYKTISDSKTLAILKWDEMKSLKAANLWNNIHKQKWGEKNGDHLLK